MRDAKGQLRRYLEQRRELGESELVLDSMSVDEVLRTVGALRGRQGGQLKRRLDRAQDPQDRTPESSTAVSSVVPSVHLGVTDALPVSESSHVSESISSIASTAASPLSGTAPAVRRSTPTKASESTDIMKTTPQGLVVGTVNESLFAENPLAHVKSLDEIAKLVNKCTQCDLYKTATNGVPGEGDPKAELVCVGEAPGAKEDETGRPFVGAAGQLLVKILAAIDLRREDIFICNVLKHRPPGNRNPQPDEVKACSPYLVRQIELIKPKAIIAFGTFAAQTLLETKTPIGKLRGAIHRYYGVPLIVTYHPAALLRNPAWKRPTWEDVQLARRILDNKSA